jgi:putative tricarboxylic transport membrane protein
MTGGKSWNDISFAIVLIVAGVGGVVLTSNLRVGDSVRMGPGYVPVLLSWLSIAFGVAVGIRGCSVGGPAPTAWAVRPLLAVSAAIGAFMYVDRVGLVASVFAVALLASLGDPDMRWRQAVGLALLLAIFASLVFVRALGLPIPLWPALLWR